MGIGAFFNHPPYTFVSFVRFCVSQKQPENIHGRCWNQRLMYWEAPHRHQVMAWGLWITCDTSGAPKICKATSLKILRPIAINSSGKS